MYSLTICSTMVKTCFGFKRKMLTHMPGICCFQRWSRKMVWSKSQGNQTSHHLIQNRQKNYGVSNNHKFCWLMPEILYVFEIIMVMSNNSEEWPSICIYLQLVWTRNIRWFCLILHDFIEDHIYKILQDPTWFRSRFMHNLMNILDKILQ